jgi:hypothetical protein
MRKTDFAWVVAIAGFVLLYFLVIVSVAHAQATGTEFFTDNVYTRDINGAAVPGTTTVFRNENPPALCGPLVAHTNILGTTTAMMANASATCQWRKTASLSIQLCFAKLPNGSCYGGVILGTPASNCWANSIYAISSTFGHDNPGACAYGPPGCEWNPATETCENPPCPSGEEFDDEIGACRAQCTEGEFYHYNSAKCVPRCPSGLSSPDLLISNGRNLGTLVTSTVNGCPVEHHFTCEVDVQDTGYYHGDDYTGQVCLNWFTYKQLPDLYRVITQEEWEAETGSAGYYTGEDEGLNMTNFSPPQNLATITYPIETTEDPAELQLVYTTCQAGIRRAVITVNGTIEEVIFGGACPQQDQGFETPSRPKPGEATTGEKIDNILEKQDEAKGLMDDVKDVVDEVKDLGQRMANVLGVGDDEGEGEGEDPGPTGPTETPDVSEQYTSDYEHGLDGVIQGAQDGLATTGITSWLNGLVPALPSSVPECLTFTLNVPFYAREFDITPDCRVWEWLRIIFLMSTIAGCYGVIFGRD